MTIKPAIPLVGVNVEIDVPDELVVAAVLPVAMP
jgi:hypothetical protein